MTDDEARDELAAIKASFDQFRESTKELATVIASYFEALSGLGFERREALDLTLSYQALLLASLWNQPREP